MRRALEFHDSVVATVVPDEGGLIVDLSPGYVHESDGNPGISAGRGYLQDIRLRFEGVALGNADFLRVTGTISGGTITVGTSRYENVLPIPFAYAGDVEATFVLSESDSRFVLVAKAFEASARGEARYVENFPGNG